jgi:hypothetical protein
MAPNKFDVVVWIRETGSLSALRDELLRLAGSEPDESTSHQGMVDLHWGFTHLADAQRVATALSRISSRSDIVLLRLSNYENLDSSVTYKDERFTRH